MKVKCINDKNSKLIEGQIYEALDICGSNIKQTRKNGNYAYERILLKNGDYYHNTSRFSKLNGDNLNDVDLYYNKEDEEVLELLKSNITVEGLTGQWLCCKSGAGSKYFIKGNYYKVKEIHDWGWYYELKIEGYDNYYSCNRFRLLSKKERRELNIDIINGIEVPTTNFNRKFDVLSSDEKINIIIKKLYHAKNEIAKNDFKDISIEDYIISKDKIYNINMDDIEEMKKIKIGDLFK